MLKQKNFDYWDGAMALLRPWTFFVPDGDTDLIVTSVVPTTLSAGDELTLNNSNGGGTWTPMPVNIRFNPTEASGTDLAMTFEISGINQFGELTKETVSTSGSTDAFTANCYARVDKIVCTAVANAHASDTLTVGVSNVNTSTKY